MLEVLGEPFTLPFVEVTRLLGAMLTSVLVVSRSALPLEAGSMETIHEVIIGEVRAW